MAKPRVLVLRAAGVNCEQETAHAWRLAGAEPTILHINALRQQPQSLDRYQVLTVPGGFSYGDDISAGKIFANELMLFLSDALRAFAERDHLTLGICNGFQVLCKAGLLPGSANGAALPAVTVTHNLSAKYEDRWVRLKRYSDLCPFLSGRDDYELPVAHGEGRVMSGTVEDMQQLEQRGCVALKYASASSSSAKYPENPNGSMLDAAGMCDPSGRIFGLMPHPERYVHHTQHPEWTSQPTGKPHGLSIFESAVAYFSR